MTFLLQISAFLALLNFAAATPVPAENKIEACTFNLPSSYAALGDSSTRLSEETAAANSSVQSAAA